MFMLAMEGCNEAVVTGALYRGTGTSLTTTCDVHPEYP